MISVDNLVKQEDDILIPDNSIIFKLLYSLEFVISV